jgi:hypothetical protein
LLRCEVDQREFQCLLCSSKLGTRLGVALGVALGVVLGVVLGYGLGVVSSI